MSFKKYRQEKKLPIVKETIAENSIIIETTVPEHLQHISQTWNHHDNLSDETRDKLNAAMGGIGKSFTTFPLTGQNNHDIDADVAEHLTKHNYKIKDYTKGIATTKKQVGDISKGIPLREKMVDEKIGSILDRTKASDAVKKAFINDPARTAYKGLHSQAGQHIVITHSPLGISGMSTGTAWSNQSCMDQGRNTEQSYKLEDDSQNGTHVAYLVNHNDTKAFKHGEPENPIARIAIKPYHAEYNDHHSDTIFRPENKVYGAGSSQFESAVNHWAIDKYPAKAGIEYTKNSHVYDDTSNKTYKSITKDDAAAAAKTNTILVNIHGMSVDKDVIDHYINKGKEQLDSIDKTSGNMHEVQSRNFVQNAAKIGNLNTQHIAQLHKMSNDRDAHLALASLHGEKLSSMAIANHIETFGKDKIPNRMLMNSKLPESVIDHIEPDRYINVRRSLLQPKHYDKVIESYTSNKSGSSYALNDHAEHFSKENIDTLANIPAKLSNGFANPAKVPLHIVLPSKHFTKEQHQTLINSFNKGDDNRHAYDILKDSKFATISDADKIDGRFHLSNLAQNKHLDQDTQINLKNRLIAGSTIPSKKEDGGNYYIHGFGNGYHIPSNLSQHMTEDDHKILANSDKKLSFENPAHSVKHLTHISKLMDAADNELTDHIENQTEHYEKHNLGDYDHTDEHDQHANALKDTLHKHVEHLATALDYHIDNHVSNNESYETIKDEHHANVIDKHLGKIHSLSSYNTPENSNNDHEHYDDHVSSIAERMEELKNNTENSHEYW